MSGDAQPALLLSGSVAAASSSQTLKRTALFDRHVDAGAKLVPFAGWEMPVQYGARNQPDQVHAQVATLSPYCTGISHPAKGTSFAPAST